MIIVKLRHLSLRNLKFIIMMDYLGGKSQESSLYSEQLQFNSISCFRHSDVDFDSRGCRGGCSHHSDCCGLCQEVSDTLQYHNRKSEAHCWKLNKFWHFREDRKVLIGV